jgi:SAM-dependent methyltransferase
MSPSTNTFQRSDRNRGTRGQTPISVKLRVNLIGLLRPALVLLAVFFVVGCAGLAYESIRTIQQLKTVEAERDLWQRPNDIIQVLDVKAGGTVVDFGSGAGYFALKLSDAVGPDGAVLAVDLRRLSLAFLRVRELLRGRNNIETIVGEPADPHLSGVSADAVLIANTYHELSEPQVILHRLSQSMRSGGRLVIVDRSDFQHSAFPEPEESDLRTAGFRIVSRDDHFITGPDREDWWLIVAERH